MTELTEQQVKEIREDCATHPESAFVRCLENQDVIALCDLALLALRQQQDGNDYEAMLNWLGNRVLACDYGDNDNPPEIGWRIRGNLLRGPNGERQPAFMYGQSFGEAIKRAMLAASGQDQRGAAATAGGQRPEEAVAGCEQVSLPLAESRSGMQSAPHQPKAAAGQVSSHKDTDETGGAANPASAAALSQSEQAVMRKALMRSVEVVPSPDLLRGIALGIEAAAKRCDSFAQTGRKLYDEGRISAHYLQALAADDCAMVIRSLNPSDIAAAEKNPGAEKGQP